MSLSTSVHLQIHLKLSSNRDLKKSFWSKWPIKNLLRFKTLLTGSIDRYQQKVSCAPGIINEKDYNNVLEIAEAEKTTEFKPLTWKFNTMGGV